MAMEKKGIKPTRPLRFLANLFHKHKSQSAKSAACVNQTSHKLDESHFGNRSLHGPSIGTSTEDAQFDTLSSGSGLPPWLYTEVEALQISRSDNPYIQKMSSQDNLDDCNGYEVGPFVRCASQSIVSGTHSFNSPEPPYSPTKSCGAHTSSEFYSHLVRSPPPVNWPNRDLPLSPRSNGTFSPADSSDGGLEPTECSNGVNFYLRSHSEEHMLSPCREMLKTPVRGTTPELMTMSMGPDTLGCHMSSPKNPRDYRIRRNYTINLSTEDTLSPTRRRYDGPTTPSYSTCTMLTTSFTPRYVHHSRSGFSGRSLTGKKSAGESFFSSWKCTRSRRASEQYQQDAKSMESLQGEIQQRYADGFSPGVRKSSVSMSGGTNCISPRNRPITFKRYRSEVKPDSDLYIL